MVTSPSDLQGDTSEPTWESYRRLLEDPSKERIHDAPHVQALTVASLRDQQRVTFRAYM
jgi:hypothetical protein